MITLTKAIGVQLPSFEPPFTLWRLPAVASRAFNLPPVQPPSCDCAQPSTDTLSSQDRVATNEDPGSLTLHGSPRCKVVIVKMSGIIDAIGVFQSPVVTFVLGESKEEIRIPVKVLADLSHPLRRLLTAPLAAEARHFEWPDVDKNTFWRLVQWAMSKDYDLPDPTAVIIPPAEQHLEPLIGLDVGVFPRRHSCCADPKNYNEDLNTYPWQALKTNLSEECRFCHDDECVPTVAECPICQKPPRPLCHNCSANWGYGVKYYSTSSRERTQRFLELNHIRFNDNTSRDFKPPAQKADEDYTEVLLCHAKLYVLGSKHHIPRLMEFALYRLHATLLEFKLYPTRLMDIVTLTIFVFNNHLPDHHEIHTMMLQYIRCIADDLLCSGHMTRLVVQVPEFATVLIRAMAWKLDSL